jgi:hypothetical protein
LYRACCCRQRGTDWIRACEEDMDGGGVGRGEGSRSHEEGVHGDRGYVDAM